MSPKMAMKKLPEELRSVLSASLQINNFKRVVEELVYNSLDAKATSIAVRVDIQENKIQLVDNGCGITENDFDIIGQKYCTSKCVDLKTLKSVPNTYGFRGQFLANLINIAQKVKITSRFANGENTWVKIFYEGNVRDLAKTSTRPSVGTTVEVSGLFYNLHIQSKNVEALNELNEIKTLLKQLSLIHSNISISLRDDSKNEIIFKAHKNRNVYQTFGMLFNIDEKDIQEFKVEKKEYKVTAYFAKKDKDIGQYHWIYLNRKFLNRCKLHKIVNDALSKFLKPHLKRKVKTKVDDNEDVFTKRNLPFYIILLSCPYYDYDISNTSKHTNLEFRNWHDVTNLLKKLMSFYIGDENCYKQLKCNEPVKNNLKPKISDDTMRNQVRQIVEKLLKSNSKKIGVSQMQNGVKGKLSKRRKPKRENSLKLSLSKVIPSKNKFTRQLSKAKSKKNELSNEVSPIYKTEDENLKSKIKPNEYCFNENKAVQKQRFGRKESCNRERKQKSLKNKIIILDNSDQSEYLPIRKENKNITENIIQKNYSLHNDKQEEDIINGDNKSDLVESIDLKEFKNNNDAGFKNDFTQNDANMYDCLYTKGHLTKENDINTICSFTNNNTKVTLRKKVEEIIIYDYIPHPLNSYQCHDIYETRSNKSHMSSRDLVKTILSTQRNICTYDQINISDQTKNEPQRFGILSNNKDFKATIPNLKRKGLDNNTKKTRESTFDAWNFNFSSVPRSTNKLTDDRMFLSKITYESHNYNRNIYNDYKFHETGIKKTKQFITRQSRDNFILPKEKQNNTLHRNELTMNRKKYIFKPKVIKNHGVNLSLGIRNFFKTNNLMTGSSYTIEFSNSSENNILPETKYVGHACKSIPQEKDHFIDKSTSEWTLHSRISEGVMDKKSVKSYNKNTYTMTETSFDARYDCNIRNKNCKSIRYTNNVMHETYTILTNNREFSFNYTDNNNEHDKNKTTENQNGLNIVFISESKMEVEKSSLDKTINPINVCETVFNDTSSHIKSSATYESLTHMENIVKEINHDIVELPNKQNNICPKMFSQKFSHHFDAINNGHNIPPVKKSPISSMNHIAQNNYTNNNIMLDNGTFSKNFENKVMNQTERNIHQNLSNVDIIVNDYNIKNRPRFMPKGMSQIFENCNTKGVCNYKFNEEYFEFNIYEDFTNKVQINTEIFKPRIQNATDDTATAIEKVHTKLQKENSSLVFDGKLLQQAQVLGQVDDKFIAAIIKAKSGTSNFLVLFDQHAVHERIRLENNMADYFDQQQWKRVKLDDFLLKLSIDEVLYLHNYKDKFSQLGLEWNILSEYEVSVFSIPEAILGKNPRQVDKIIAAVKNLVLEEISIIKSQGGCISLHPKSIMDLVFSEACRYAIKFGDKLTLTECRELIQSLSECKTPFQCAHGRPVMAVLMEVRNHDARDYKPDMTKIRLFSVSKPKQGSHVQK